jgi:hypothetical protein
MTSTRRPPGCRRYPRRLAAATRERELVLRAEPACWPASDIRAIVNVLALDEYDNGVGEFSGARDAAIIRFVERPGSRHGRARDVIEWPLAASDEVLCSGYHRNRSSGYHRIRTSESLVLQRFEDPLSDKVIMLRRWLRCGVAKELWRSIQGTTGG